MQGQLATVFGASGFIGRNIVRELAARGVRVNAVCRDAEQAKFLKPMGAVGQVTPMRADVTDPAAVARAVAGADMVINLVGILYQSGRNTFDAVQATAPGTIAKAAADAGVRALVHVSAIGADADSRSAYARSKAAGEAAVRAAFPAATVLRPSIVFGANDSFFNRFAAMAQVMPFLPLIGGGANKFQPVYVDDVADAAIAALQRPEAAGKTYELGGPSTYTFRQLLELMLVEIRRRRPLVTVPFWLASLQAAVLELLPVPPLTRDQIELLKRDNVVAPGASTLADLGVDPTPLEIVLPTYLDAFRLGGRYAGGRAHA
ncbi:3-beta-hydroxy-Delta(5)-steroid dehydrogenase [Thalassobaculum fulvum]|uniref:3-beta-hydroxy-Delta(5)-steroid dehydrogenase n=1 Tax=Thalassobaculum fulvum TaxID=1633335 RepID=A0A919CSV8_9PROT|nr:complex I NDUFA9 subunit family protein [Thalassobaculum fulvum]GHD64003.1 3-beta-hydroxy-Delta(5)-steroid dehydrogenase [Thalassobaculum fulvum]